MMELGTYCKQSRPGSHQIVPRPLILSLPLQAILLVVATVAMAAPQYTGAHSAWPLPYAG